MTVCGHGPVGDEVTMGPVLWTRGRDSGALSPGHIDDTARGLQAVSRREGPHQVSPRRPVIVD